MELKIITQKEILDYDQNLANTGIKKFHEVFHEMVAMWGRDPKSIMGRPTADWKVFNEAFGGIRDGELITLTSDTGSGKTTFALNWLFQNLKQHVPCLIISLEIDMVQIAKTLGEMITGKNMHQWDKEIIGGLGEVFQKLPLFYLDTIGMTDENLIIKAMHYAGVEMGIKFVLLDHLDYIIKNKADHWMNESYVIGNTMRRISAKSKEIEICTLLIAHPSKLNVQGIKNREVGMDDLKGSSSIKQESDTVINIYRPDPGKNLTTLRFLKIRNGDYGLSRDGFIKFTFNPASKLLQELSTKLEWDKND